MTVFQTIANVLSALLLAEVLAFVLVYATGSPWRRTLIGRTLMYLAASMALLLVYAFTSRWLGLPEDLRQAVGTGVYAILVGMWGRLLLVLRFAQRGNVSAEHPNYTPLRDWLARHRLRRSTRAEK